MAEAADFGFPLKGAFKRTPFPMIVRQLAEHAGTGNLYLLSGETKKVVFFDAGAPVFVRSNVLKECLGQVLAAEGLITQEQCDQTLEAIRRTGKKQGALLVEMGILSEGNLRYGLEAQLRHKLFDIFGWLEGKYQFKPGKPANESALRFDATPAQLITAGIQRSYSEQRAKSALAGDTDLYIRRTEVDPGLVADEEHFWRGLDGSQTAGELVAESEDGGVLIFALVSSGCAVLDKSVSEAQPRVAPPDLAARERPDDEFDPGYEPQQRITEYEDTPLPGELPERPRGLHGDGEDVFAGAGEDSKLLDLSRMTGEHQIDPDLVSAEVDVVETFEDEELEFVSDEDIEVLDEEDVLEEAEYEPGAPVAEMPAPAEDLEADESGLRKRRTGFLGSRQDLEHTYSNPDAIQPDDSQYDIPMDGLEGESPTDGEQDIGAAGDDLLGDDDLANADLGDVDDDLALDPDGSDDDLLGDDLDELDDIDLGDDADYGHSDATAADDDDAEVQAAMHFSEGEAALALGEWTRAIEELEYAYEGGIDVAELHAMLAYGRFQESGHSPDMATHALELLAYAEGLSPEVDIIYAYRGAVLWSTGDMDGAHTALERALQVNPYCDLAMELMDQLNA